jgi:hypothetical protein
VRRASWLWLAQVIGAVALFVATAACVFVALGIVAHSF